MSFGNKKLRGIPRRLRSLKQWATSFEKYFPEITDDDYASGYWSVKIPVASSLVQGAQTTQELQAYCAQMLINACAHLNGAKPADVDELRVTCCIVLPDMFASEICIYTNDNYFQKHTSDGNNIFGKRTLIANKSLSCDWSLALPASFGELGISCLQDDYHSDLWYFGDVLT